MSEDAVDVLIIGAGASAAALAWKDRKFYRNAEACCVENGPEIWRQSFKGLALTGPCPSGSHFALTMHLLLQRRWSVGHNSLF